jgi:hypothetical protein
MSTTLLEELEQAGELLRRYCPFPLTVKLALAARIARIREEEAKLAERLRFWGLPRDSSGYAYSFDRLTGPLDPREEPSK